MILLLAGGCLLVLSLSVYLWWQRTPLAPKSLARRAPLPPMMNLRKSTVIGAAVLLLLLCSGTVYLVRAWWPRFTRKPVPAATTSPRGATPASSFLDRFPTEYPSVKKADAAPLPPKGIPVPPQTAVAQSPPTTPPQPPITREELQGMIERAVTRAIAAQPKPQPHVITPQTPEMAAQQRTARLEDEERARKKKQWTVSQPTSIQATQSEQKATEGNKGQEKAQTLIPDAVWVKPDHPELVLYRDQFIPGILLDAANSDIPGQLRVKVSRDVLDRTLRGVVLIPQFSTVVGQLDGEPKYGQTLLNVTLDQIIFPDGTVLELAKTKLGEADGSTGVQAKVNNHYGKLLLGVGLSAVLNIGVQSAAGTPSSFYATPTQQASRDAAQQLNADAKRIVDQQLRVPPTLTQAAGHEVSLHLSENINLGKAPIRVH